MRIAVVLFAALLAAALAPVPAQAARVVSLNLCTDEYLLLLAPAQAVAVTFLARDPTLSVVAGAAARLPAVRADAEAVLTLRPDLVLAGPTGAQATLAVLAARGVRIERIDPPEDFAAIVATTRRLGALLGATDRAEALLADMQARLAAVPPHAARRTVFVEPRLYADGPGTLADAVLRAAGERDDGTGRRLSLETLVAHPPDLLVLPEAPATPSQATDVLHHPALRGIPVRTVAPALLACGGPWTARAVTALAR
jgi:iron complex transport system substrate-binding protein